MSILEEPKVIRPETLQHDVLWVEVVTDGNSGDPKRKADAFARQWAERQGYNKPICVTSGASLTPERIEWRYGYGIHSAEPVEPQHADYPHEPGTLYDCPACDMPA